MASTTDRTHPLHTLDEADVEFVLRFVLASGSLKEMAQSYGVSYPTIRARLDRIITHLGEALAGREADPMADLLASLVARGEMAAPAARAVLELHRKASKRSKGG